MNTQMTRAQGHNYEDDPHHQNQGVAAGLHSGGHDQDEQHEKKSVIKKVKDKAKKIKDTLGLKKHGQDHDHDHDHDHDQDQDLDEEDDYYEEIEQDPEVHGAPMYESAAAGLGLIEKEEKVKSGQPMINLGQSAPFEEDPHAPKDRTGTFSPGNYQTKVTDPTGAGGTEANVEPMIRSFGKMECKDEPEPEHKLTSGTGSHDQLSPDTGSIGTKTIPENPQSVSQSTDATKPEHHPEHMNVDEEPRNQTSSYTEKLSSATSAIAGKAISAKNVVASKLGYGGNVDNVAQSEMKKDGEGEQPNKSSTAAVGGYGRQIASTVTEKLTPVYEKVAGAGSAVVSKVQNTVAGTGTDTGKGKGKGSGTETGTGTDTGTGKEEDKGISIKGYLTEKFSPGDEDKALSEVISDVMYKRKEEFPEHIAKSMDKVTESPEVASRLGSDDHENKEGSGNGSSGSTGGSGSQAVGNNKGMVDRVKGVVGSWFGKGGVGDSTESSRSPDSLNVDEQEKVSGEGSGVGHESAGIVH